MVRLTHRDNSGEAYTQAVYDMNVFAEPQYRYNESGIPVLEKFAKEMRGSVVDRLAQYEDAEESGKLVMLPFGVGKQIFSTRYGEVETGTVWQVEINSYTSPVVWIRFTVQSKLFGPMDGHTRIDLAARDGIYFTSEEAEAALKGENK